MSSKQRWMINDALGLLLQLSRAFCLAPVRFVEISTDTFIYMSRPLLIFSVIIASIAQLCIIYFLYFMIDSTARENYRHLFLGVFHVAVIVVLVSYAVLHTETRIKNYMTCFTVLKRAVIGLQSTEEYSIQNKHIFIMLITLMTGIAIVLILSAVIYNGSVDPLTCILILEFTMTVVIQQKFLYFALYLNFVLKIIEQQLQEELSKIISDNRLNIPLESINKAIDMIGITEELFPDKDVFTRRRQNIAQRILQIDECYVLACEVLRELSRSDDFLLFLQLISLSFHLVFSSYDIIILFRQDGTFLPAKLTVQCLQILVLIIRLIMVVEPCHVAHETILNIRYLVCEIMCYVTSKNDPVYRVMEGFYHQFILNDVSYTALGIYKIGRPLVTSILGVATTILIAIFEF